MAVGDKMAVESLRRQLQQAEGVMMSLASFVGNGASVEWTSMEDADARIRDGIDHLTKPLAALAEEWRKRYEGLDVVFQSTKAGREQAEARLEEAESQIVTYQARCYAAEARVAKLEGALRRYGRHEDKCYQGNSGMLSRTAKGEVCPCTCGLWAALSAPGQPEGGE
jgi:chromosome segregation ATPase